MEDCIYYTMCNHTNCGNCLRYSEMAFMLSQSNIPLAKQQVNTIIPDECDLRAFEQLARIRDTIRSFVLFGNNLYLYSATCGNGKTTWAIKLMLQYFDSVWVANNYTERGVFINVNSFLFDLKASFDKYDEYTEHLKEIVPTVDLVIWDDICSSKLSQYDRDLILNLLDKRIVNSRANIFTGNIVPERLKDFVGDRLYSRICGERVTKIQLCGVDRR